MAVGTLALAVATFWMARGTAKLARTAERQRQEAITPVVRVIRSVVRHDIAAMRVAFRGEPNEFLLVPLENLGPTAVEIESVKLDPGGTGQIASQEEYLSPKVEPGQNRYFEFRMSAGELADCRSGRDVVLTVVYRSVVNHSQFRHVERLKQHMDGWGQEQWIIVRSETPRRIDWVEA